LRARASLNDDSSSAESREVLGVSRRETAR